MFFILSTNIPNPIPLSIIIKLIFSKFSFKEISIFPIKLTSSIILSCILSMEFFIKLIKELDDSILINFDANNDSVVLNCDNEQLSRVFLNLIKNSIESIVEKKEQNPNFIGKINISIFDSDDYIVFVIIDNGKGFDEMGNNINDILNPYFTTKKKGSGLGLSIVNKIINDHNGSINFYSYNGGAKLEIKFSKKWAQKYWLLMIMQT